MKNKSQYIYNAIEWVKGQLNSKEYCTLCLAFVEDAYEMSNSVEIFGGSTARESADEYSESDYKGIPEVGSFVFYDCSGTIGNEHKNWGHVGLYIGNEQVIHAWDVVRIDHYIGIETLPSAPGWSSPKYTGWVPFERIFKGYRIL
ncbi:MAG: NlpC/P60 family protein [Fibrobacterota bacterium]|nr:NlpC/P60 family protein [Chitinispirillaceae bacterium]